MSRNLESKYSSIDDVIEISKPSNLKESNFKSMENGAIRKGERPNIFTKTTIGYTLQYACVGLLYGALPRTVYPFFNNYLQMEGYQTSAVSTLLWLPWSFKLFYGIVTDCFPILGYRRKPYMLLGWGLVVIALLVMAFLDLPKPYYSDPTFSELSAEELEDILLNNPDAINSSAPDKGGLYTILMMMICVGYLFPAVAADGMTVEYAQREPEEIRGQTQSMIYIVRTITATLAKVLMAFAMNGGDYGGQFNWSLSLNELSWILMISPVVGIIAAIFFLEEEKYESQNFFSRCKDMWHIAQERCIWQIVFFQFFYALFHNWKSTPNYPVQKEWAGVTPFNDSLAGIMGSFVFLFTLYAVKQWGLSWNWRRTLVVTTLSVVALDGFVVLLTVYDVVRSQWFWLGGPILEEFPGEINFLIGTFVIVEVANEGYEAATYGLLTTVMNLGSPIATSLSNISNIPFDVSQDDIKTDTSSIRHQVTYCYLIQYSMKILGLVFVFLLPRQKKEAQELKKNGGRNKVVGAITVFGIFFFFVWGIVCNMLSIFPETSCLIIAGGKGC